MDGTTSQAMEYDGGSLSDDHGEVKPNLEKVEDELQDSPLCEYCRSLRLSDVVRLHRDGNKIEDIPDYQLQCWQDDGDPITRACQLCRIAREADRFSGASPVMSTYYSRTVFLTAEIVDTVLFEFDSRAPRSTLIDSLLGEHVPTTPLLVPLRCDLRHGDDDGKNVLCVAGRVIDPHRVDYTLLRGWLFDCSLNHGTACSGELQEDPLRGLRGLKVIDCVTRKIVLAPDFCRYVALSYCWGHSPRNVPRLQQGDQLGEGVPQVVEDAIIVAMELELPYLWVDQHCIDQADDAERQHFLRNMDAIYDAAVLTIVATAGEHSNFGLPGVAKVARRQQESIVLGGRRFLFCPDSRHEIHRSLWSTRAWTYQEGLLSRRRLVFTESQVYFQCREKDYYERLYVSPGIKTSKRSFRRVFPENGIGQEAGDIVRRLEDYVPRKLTYDADILNAVLGIFRRYESKNVYHIWGIPFFAGQEPQERKQMDHSFATALGWDASFEEPISFQEPAARREGFPAWSWAGWSYISILRIPWAPPGLTLSRGQGEDVCVKVYQRATHCMPEREIPLAGYVDRIASGDASFGDFSQTITISGPASKLSVRHDGSINYDFIDLPRDLPVRSRVCMGTGTSRVSLSQSVDIIYITCDVSIECELMFLVVQKAEHKDEYTRAGTVKINLSRPQFGTEFDSRGKRDLLPLHLEAWLPSLNRHFQEKWAINEFRFS
ncbi:HET-domain-containing protein [Coniochaeta ligniaria NRRL 30616]|uniref:HET-domain-containing protein n=1 Tax=Coniochaeta ligniaria NRRL 30616 TaxID=1408157 RepID=A0A1J7IRT6_9PEZI|nr:HET-domain-containing protein [Coniochaeta ligniaria NRRL 30616]